jgi:hypothetical protein
LATCSTAALLTPHLLGDSCRFIACHWRYTVAPIYQDGWIYSSGSCLFRLLDGFCERSGCFARLCASSHMTARSIHRLSPVTQRGVLPRLT